MSTKDLKQFVQLRAKLLTEKAELEARLEAINEALDLGAPAAGVTTAAASTSAVKKTRGRRRSKMSLVTAVEKVTSAKALTREEILEAVQKIGYRFTGKKPIASLGAVLYGKKSKFKNLGGKFQPA